MRTRSFKQNSLSSLLALATLIAMNGFAPAQAQQKAHDTRLFEMRTYHAAPGKLDALSARFRNHTVALFEKHGMQNIGYWTPIDNKDNLLIYILAYPNREARDTSWKAFIADPNWQTASKASETDGKLVQKVESIYLTSTDYSPIVKPFLSGRNRAFELRTYMASPGKLDALNARFRNHTIGLFSKHGMTHVGYWTPTAASAGATTTLIYILAHDAPDARDKSFAGFREDPQWTRAKADSEKDGSLTMKVESVMMKPTDYSPTN
jgi:hypothetical protein